MGFPRRLLADHEELILDLRPHWIALVLPALAAILILVALILFFGNFDPPQAVTWIIWIGAVVMFLVYPVPAVLAWLTSHFVVTSDRVIHRSGWLAKRSMEMPLERINDVTFNQTVLERVVAAGSLRIESAGEHGQNHFRDIRDPEAVQKRIYELGEDNENRMRGMAGPGAGGPTEAPSTGGSPLEEIERLASMKKRGLISEEEFETQKRRLLGRL